MTFHTLGKLAGTLALTLALAGCIDATMEVEVTSQTTGKATMTQVMDKSIYDMIQSAGDETEMGSTFCDEGTISLTDDKAICVLTKEGPFADLRFDEEEGESVTFTAEGPNLVRVSFPTASMKAELGADEDDMDAETRAMMQSFFEGHGITLKVSGGQITDSNMDIAADGQSASHVIDFVDLINGEIELDDLYAVVRK